MAKHTTPANAFEPGQTNAGAVRGAPATPQRDRKDAATNTADDDAGDGGVTAADPDAAATPRTRTARSAKPAKAAKAPTAAAKKRGQGK